MRNPRRDSDFRRSVVSAWAHRCAFYRLACCSIHHQAFDRGAITISDDLLILVSSRVYGGGKLDDLFLSLHGAPLPKPTLTTAQPRREFLRWHRSEVFRGAARS
jgi:putative restriction endonuclease